MKTPLISIIVPLYNRLGLVDATIESVVKQTYSNWELIIVDDGSTDGSYERILEWQNKFPKQIQVIRRNRHPKGAPTCRNIGYAKSHGDYIIFLDSDDILAIHAIEQRVNYFASNTGLDLLITPCLLFKEKINDTSILWNIEKEINDIDRYLVLDVPWGIHQITWKREAINKIGLWDEKLLSWQDWELGIRMLLNNTVYKKMGKPDCYWRISTNNRQSIGVDSASLPHLKSHFYLIRKIYSQLNQHNCLSITRKKLLIKLCFWLFDEWKIHNKLSAFIALNKLLYSISSLHEHSLLCLLSIFSISKRTNKLKLLLLNKLNLKSYFITPISVTLRSQIYPQDKAIKS